MIGKLQRSYNRKVTGEVMGEITRWGTNCNLSQL